MSREEVNGNKCESNGTPVDPLLFRPAVNEEHPVEKPNFFSRFSGILYTLIASFLFVAPTFIVKELGIDLLDALLLRFVLQAISTLSFAFYKNYTLLGGTAWEIFLQILCCGTGALGFLLYFLAIRYIEIPDANTVCYTRVVWTVVLSVIVYRERPSISTLIALPLTLIGVVFVTQPTFLFPKESLSINPIDYKYRLLGFAFVLTVAFTSAINVLLFKQLISKSKDIKPSVFNFQFTFSVVILLASNQLYKIFYLQTPVSFTFLYSWRFILSAFVCMISILASILTQKAIKREHPAVFSLLGSSDIIFSLILQNIFTSKHSNAYALIGSGLVILSVVILGIGRIRNEQRTKNEKQTTDQC